MTNWKTFKIRDGSTLKITNDYGTLVERFQLDLYEYVEYRNGYKKSAIISWWNTTPCGIKDRYVEIDLDKAKHRNSDDTLHGDWWRIIPEEVVTRRAMTEISSASPEISATINDGISRMNRGEIREFEHKIEDTRSNKHYFTYRK